MPEKRIERLKPAGAPEPRGPYSPAVRAGDLVYVSAQGPVNPATGKIETGDVKDQTKLVLENVKLVLAAAQATFEDVVKCQVYLKNREDFSAMNAVYEEFLGTAKPSRTTLVGELVLGPEVKVMIDAVAYRPLA